MPRPRFVAAALAATVLCAGPASGAGAQATPPPPPTTIPPLSLPFDPSEEIPTPAEPLQRLWPARPIVFPVAGPVRYSNDWGACRGGPSCPRLHVGNDLIGVRLQPVVAARDGWVTHLVDLHVTAGNGIVITDDEGWGYRYYHLNNDAPGTDDASNPRQWLLAPGIGLGSRVRAGQLIAYLGDSGNSEGSVPHVHFELRTPDGQPVNPYASLRAAESAARCTLRRHQVSLPGPAAAVDPHAAKVVQVPTLTGRGRFTLSTNGAAVLEGDALVVGEGKAPVLPNGQPVGCPTTDGAKPQPARPVRAI